MPTHFFLKDKIKVGIDLHNLSTRSDCVVRTGIQQVIFNLLSSQFAIRNKQNIEVEIIPLPVLPIVSERTDFPDSMPNHVNNSFQVLQESAHELGVPLAKLWNSEFVQEKNWTDERFFQIASTLDWIVLTGLCDFRTVLEKIKILNPEIRVAILVYDLIPLVASQLTASGMPAWFEHSYLDGMRYFADMLFTISKHTALDCEQFLKGHIGHNIPIISTTLPPEIPEFIDHNLASDAKWLAQFCLQPQKYFVCLGTIEPRKNLILAVRGFIDFHKRFPEKSEFKLCMVGKAGWNNEDAALQQEIGHLADKFVFPGYLDRIAVEKIVHYSRGLAMPSRYEGFGMPLTLANIHGVKTISAINSSLPEATQLNTAFVNPENIQEMMLAFYMLSNVPTNTNGITKETQTSIRNMWNDLLERMMEEIYRYKQTPLPPIKKLEKKKKIIIEVHNLSILPNIIQKTGIQEVAHSILYAAAKLRKKYADRAEIICLPFIPDMGYVMQFAATFNCDPPVLQEIEQKSGLSSHEFWGFDFAKFGYTLNAYGFSEIVKNADYFIVTTQYDINRVLPKLKSAAPHVSISSIVYDIIPTLYPQAVVPGLSTWFTHTLLRSFRANTSKVFGISRSATLDYLNNTENETLDAEAYALRLPINQTSVKTIDNTEILQKLDLVPQKYFVVVGNNDPRKNVSSCILGFIKFCELFPVIANDISLLLIGPKVWLTDDLTEARLKARGRCHIVESGYLPDADMHSAVKHSAGLLMPSHYEGFGIPLALARSYGVPTLTCVNSSLPEVTEANSSFVNPMNTTEIALGMKVMLDTSPSTPCSEDTWNQYVTDLIELHLI